MWRVEPQTAFKGVVHPQNDIFSIDYSCLGHLSSMVFFCICRIRPYDLILCLEAKSVTYKEREMAEKSCTFILITRDYKQGNFGVRVA